MSNLLSSDAIAQLSNRLEADNLSENVVAEQKPETREVEVEVKKDENQESVPSTDSDNDEGHSIPYKRFKSVVETKNELKSQKAALERQLEELKSQLNVKSNEPKETKADDEFENLLRQFDDVDAPDERYTSLESRIKRFEEQAAQKELESELNSVLKKYPNVPEAVLLQAVVNDPSSNMESVARQYDAFVSEIQQSAINDYMKTSKAAPRRPTSSGATGPSPSAKPRTLEGARSAALEYFKQLQG